MTEKRQRGSKQIRNLNEYEAQDQLSQPEWYQDAIFYLLDVEIYQDSDGDGIGDLPGLISRLPYLADLGVTCLWLMPFFPSTGNDDGYAVIEYLGVEKGLGRLD